MNNANSTIVSLGSRNESIFGNKMNNSIPFNNPSRKLRLRKRRRKQLTNERFTTNTTTFDSSRVRINNPQQKNNKILMKNQKRIERERRKLERLRHRKENKQTKKSEIELHQYTF